MSRLQQDVSTPNHAGATRVDSHREEALHLRYLRQGVRPEARFDMSQKETPGPAASLTCNFHQEHCHGVHERIREKSGYQDRMNNSSIFFKISRCEVILIVSVLSFR